MRIFITLIFMILIISKVHSKLPDEIRKNLLAKLTKKMTLENINQLEDAFISNDLRDTSIDYDPTRIANLINEYNFPEEYNFLEDIKATIRVKDQANCGCCWAHSSSSALAYRYQKLGMDIDLSPQYSLSCYIRDCEAGNYLIDPQLNLIKNGTVTEQCLPFSSSDGIHIEECPEKCKNGEDLKKYYARNTYMTQDYYSKDTFYDIVSIIMDQLVTNGPVVSAITIYTDFMKLHSDPQCGNKVYTYDGTSKEEGGHAVAIVGYGLLDGKYYWLIQNSWGEEACDKGFVKVEFGQVGVENVAFSEPYIPDEEVSPQEIPVHFDNIDEGCFLSVYSSSSYDNWVNTLDLNFKNEYTSQDFNFLCSTTSFFGQSNKLNCYFEIKNYFGDVGEYKFNDSNSLGRENEFSLDDSFKNLAFYFWGNNNIMTYWDFYQYYFISRKGSKIMFAYSVYTNDGEILNPIYPNLNTDKALSDCHKIELNYESWVYCGLKEEEIDYFEDFSQQSNSPLVYDSLCGYKANTFTLAYKLNKNRFPAFIIDSLTIPNKTSLTENDKLTATAQIEGSLSYFDNSEVFVGFANIEYKGANSSIAFACIISVPKSTNRNHNIDCNLLLNTYESIKFDNIYLLPYYIPYRIKYIYEVIINGDIKGSEEDTKPDPFYFLYLEI